MGPTDEGKLVNKDLNEVEDHVKEEKMSGVKDDTKEKEIELSEVVENMKEKEEMKEESRKVENNTKVKESELPKKKKKKKKKNKNNDLVKVEESFDKNYSVK